MSHKPFLRRHLPSGSGSLTVDEVEFAYTLLLGRGPDDDEVAHQMIHAQDLRVLLQGIVASDEYRRGRQEPLRPPPAVVNVFSKDLAGWGHQPGARSADGVAIVGTEGWLFLVEGTNAIVGQYRGEVEAPADWESRWIEAAEVRRAEATALGAQIVGVVVPDKLPVLAAHFPEPFPVVDRPPARRLAALPGVDVIYPVEELGAVAGGAYLRTDTHLTFAGNAALAGLVASCVGAQVSSQLPPTSMSYVSSGDLGSRFSPPIVEIVTHAGGMGAAELVEDNRPQIAAVGGHIGTRQVFRQSQAPDQRTVVIFGDSYAYGNAHYQGLAWFLAQAFAEVHFVWVPFGWDREYAARIEAEVVVWQGAERFAIRPPAQRVDATGLADETIARRRGVTLDELG